MGFEVNIPYPVNHVDPVKKNNSCNSWQNKILCELKDYFVPLHLCIFAPLRFRVSRGKKSSLLRDLRVLRGPIIDSAR